MCYLAYIGVCVEYVVPSIQVYVHMLKKHLDKYVLSNMTKLKFE